MAKPNPFVVKLKTSIPYSDQNAIISSVKQKGSLALVEQDALTPFWIADGVTEFCGIIDKRIPIDLLQRYFYLIRGHEAYKWKWKNSREALIIKQALHPLQDFISHIRRVAIVIQIPGQPVPAHRDMLVGNSYDFMDEPTATFTGSKRMRYVGDEWFYKLFGEIYSNAHESQGYFGLRIPLSEKPEENNRAYVESLTSGEKTYYDPGNNLFLLNEADVNHGADAVDFYRGVVIVDCTLKISSLSEYRLP